MPQSGLLTTFLNYRKTTFSFPRSLLLPHNTMSKKRSSIVMVSLLVLHVKLVC
jgi:hypothetical protein